MYVYIHTYTRIPFLSLILVRKSAFLAIYIYIHKNVHTFIYIHICSHIYLSLAWFQCEMVPFWPFKWAAPDVTWLIHMCDMTHSYVWHDSFICVTWLIHMCNMTDSYVRRDSFILSHDSFIRVVSHDSHNGVALEIWLFFWSSFWSDITHSYAFMCETCGIRMFAPFICER